jgi:superfamily II DNA helicase RecQ
MIDEAIYIRVSDRKKEIIQNVLERKDSMALLPMGFRKSMCYVLPSFWTR